MSAAMLRLGSLGPPDLGVTRSGLRWLAPDGHRCRPGELIAYCTIAAPRRGGLFEEEGQDLQAAFAAPCAGRLRRAPDGGAGYLDRLPFTRWSPETPLCRLEDAPEDVEPRLLMLAGRRMSDSAEDRSGLMTGYHDRVRAWWGEPASNTILAAGTCEQDAVLRGAGRFEEMFASRPAAAHVTLWQDEPQVPCARTLIEQIDRGDAEIAAIGADMARGVAGGGEAPTGQDLLFLGALLNALARKPLDESYDVITRAGLGRIASAPRHLCLSLSAEPPRLLRHQTLGYAVNLHHYRLARLGPALRRWLKASFDPVPRAVEDVAADYRALLERLPAASSLLVLNAVSTQAYERIFNYRLLGETGRASMTLRAKRLNLLLHDLAHAGRVTVLDQDAIAAGLGLTAHLPDGTHASGTLNAALREELIRLVTPSDIGLSSAA